jgi:hypothetical protein
MLMTSGIYPWSFVTQVFYIGLLGHINVYSPVLVQTLQY